MNFLIQKKNINNNEESNNLTKDFKKINIMSFKLKESEIQSLKTLKFFEYLGEINKEIKDVENSYFEIEYIILELDNVKYNWETYKFLLDKKIIIEFTAFLLEFINEQNFEENEKRIKFIMSKLNKISINNDLIFFNKNYKNLYNNQNNYSLNDKTILNNKIKFFISKLININESKIIVKLLKKYLKGNIIDEKNKSKKSKSSDNTKNKNIINFFKRNKQNIF